MGVGFVGGVGKVMAGGKWVHTGRAGRGIRGVEMVGRRTGIGYGGGEIGGG